jgi:hypothetical protein
LEESVIQQTEDDTCFLGEYGHTKFYGDDTSYGFRCDLATGHSTNAYIDIFSDRSEAEASFLARVDGQAIQDLHGYPFSAWETEFYIPDFGGKTRIAVLQAARWVIGARSDDDTHYLTAPDPADVVEGIYRRMVDLGMISPP